MTKKANIVQTRNPKVDRYVLIDREQGKILEHREEPGPYPDVPIARRRHRNKNDSWRKKRSDATPSQRARAIKERLREQGRVFSDSTEIIRADREGSS